MQILLDNELDSCKRSLILENNLQLLYLQQTIRANLEKQPKSTISFNVKLF